jgi:hypothetical protein
MDGCLVDEKVVLALCHCICLQDTLTTEHFPKNNLHASSAATKVEKKVVTSHAPSRLQQKMAFSMRGKV